jgi:hypothetical protein
MDFEYFCDDLMDEIAQDLYGDFYSELDTDKKVVVLDQALGVIEDVGAW